MNESMMHMVARQYGITPLPENPSEAMAYVPFQTTGNVYSAEQGMSEGTMFPELNKPFQAAAPASSTPVLRTAVSESSALPLNTNESQETGQ